MVALSHGTIFPLCQMFSVLWMGIKTPKTYRFIEPMRSLLLTSNYNRTGVYLGRCRSLPQEPFPFVTRIYRCAIRLEASQLLKWTPTSQSTSPQLLFYFFF